MELFNRDNLPEMYTKTLWMNPDNEYVINQNIVEYDMQSASLSVSRRFHLLDDKLLDQLSRMPKEKRTKLVGLRQRDDKEFSENMINGVLRTRKEFIEKNKLDEDTIIALHSDALMFIQKHPVHDNIGGVPFIKKNEWTSYIRYDRLEMFYNNGIIDYKGIPKQMLQQHTLGICQYMLQIFALLEDNDREAMLHYINRFQRMYLQDKFPEYYYLPFGNAGGKYKAENLKLFSFIAKIVIQEMG